MAPRLLFVAPSAWVPPVKAAPGVTKRAGYHDAARGKSRCEEWYRIFLEADWFPSHWDPAMDDVVAVARSEPAPIIIIPTYRHEEGTAKLLRELAPAPTVLVAVEPWDRTKVEAVVKYTGADGWFPYLGPDEVATAARIWRRGPPTPDDEATMSEWLPKRAIKGRRRSGS